MPIYIFDNGMKYSDHKMVFLDMVEEELPVFENLIKIQSTKGVSYWEWERAKIIAKASDLEWFVPASSVTFDTFLKGDIIYIQWSLETVPFKAGKDRITGKHIIEEGELRCMVCGKILSKYVQKENIVPDKVDCLHSVPELLAFLKAFKG